MLTFYLSLLDTEEEKSRFRQIYEKYRLLMWKVANDILKDNDLAEDAVHEAFIRIAKNFHKIDEVYSPRTKNFAVVIVRNVSLTMLKKEKRMKADEFDEQLHGSAEKSVDESVFESFEKGALSYAVQSLPEIYRDLLYLRFYNELSMSEAASVLGITEEAAKKRSQRAVKMLRDIMTKEDEKSE